MVVAKCTVKLMLKGFMSSMRYSAMHEGQEAINSVLHALVATASRMQLQDEICKEWSDFHSSLVQNAVKAAYKDICR